ncbi:MAG: RNA polymerase sigma factor [Verrucomicrobiota bacterium]
MKEPVADEALVAQVLKGEIGAYDELVLKYKERLYGVIYNMTSNHEDTNDLLMETFDKAYRHLGSFKEESAFYTWIYKIAINQTLNFIKRRKKRQKDLSINDIEFEGNSMDLEDTSSVSAPEKNLQIKELQKKLNESLQKLSDEHRKVVELFDIEGRSHGEIGQMMSCSEGTVRSRLHYAHKQLQKWLEKIKKN